MRRASLSHVVAGLVPLVGFLLLNACSQKDAPAATLTAGSGDPSRVGEPKLAEAPDEASEVPLLPNQEGLPPVSLDGTSRPWPPLPSGSAARVAAIAIETPVLSQPDTSSARVGQLRAGAIVEVDPKPVSGKGCQAGFRKIMPVGYVCLGTATLDLAHPIVRASTRRPDHTQKLPYMYGIAVRGGPAYQNLPSAEVVKSLEPNLASHLKRWSADRVSGASYGNELWAKWKSEAPVPALVAMEEKRTDTELPWYLRSDARTPNLGGRTTDGPKAGEFSRRNGVSFVDSVLWEGRRYNVAVDLRLMPADRFRPIRGSELHGFRVPEDTKLPCAIVKSTKAKKLEESSGRLVASESIPWRSVLPLTGRQRIRKGRHFLEVEQGTWVAEDDVARIDPLRKPPGWANDGEKWLDINVSRQTLTAYEGLNPVYVTLVSTGEAGLEDPATTRATKRGIFRIHTKYLTATMDSRVVGEEFELRDVPYVQYFTEGYALHAAYWHDVFGQPKSHGCINLAPEDARRLFFWTGPQVPAGWHGAATGPTGKGGTVVFVHP